MRFARRKKAFGPVRRRTFNRRASRPARKTAFRSTRFKRFASRSRRVSSRRAVSRDPKSRSYQAKPASRKERYLRSSKAIPVNPFDLAPYQDNLNLGFSANIPGSGVQFPITDGSLQAWDGIDLLRMLTLCGASSQSSLAQSHVQVVRREYQLELTNNSNVTTFVDIYKCWPRHNLGLGFGPQSTWLRGMKQINSFAATDLTVIPGAKPFESKCFCTNWKVVGKVQNYTLKPGAVATWKWASEKRKKLKFNDDPQYGFNDPTNITYYRGWTMTPLMIVKGEAMHNTTIGISYLNTQLTLIVNTRTTYYTPFFHATQYATVSTLVASGTNASTFTTTMPEEAPSTAGQTIGVI